MFEGVVMHRRIEDRKENRLVKRGISVIGLVIRWSRAC